MPRALPVCDDPFNVHKKRVNKTVKPIGPSLLIFSREHFPGHNWTAQTLLCIGCRMKFYDARKLAAVAEAQSQLLEEPNDEDDNFSGHDDDDGPLSPPADMSPHPSNSQREQRQGKTISSEAHNNPFVVLDRDPVVESFITSRPLVDGNKVNKVCFGCGMSPSKGGPRTRPNLEQKTNLYKSIIINPSFRAKMSPSMYNNFAHNDQSCGDCWKMIHEVWTLHQEIVATQKGLDRLVEKGRECVMKSKSRAKVKSAETLHASQTPKRHHNSPPDLLFYPKIDHDAVVHIKEEASDHGEDFDVDDFALIPEIDRSEDRFYDGDDRDENSEEKAVDQKNPFSAQLYRTAGSDNSLPSQRRSCRKVQEEKTDPIDDLDSESSDENSTSDSDSDYELDLFNKRENSECTVCGREFRKFKQLIRHEVLVCKVAYDKRELDRVNIIFYPCKLCEKQFSSSSQLQRHVRSHTGEKPPSCPKCGKSHKNFNYTNEMLCKKCENNSEEDVKLPTPKTYQCSHCGKQLAQHINLISHEIRICKLPYDEDALRRKGIRIRRCDHALCGEVFVTSRQFKRHMLIHTGGTIPLARKHECNQCGKLFIRSQGLNLHKKMHCPAGTIDIEFKANFLEKLRQRRRQQSVRFNFQCPNKCGRRFTSKTKLVKHLVTAHPQSQRRKSL